MNVKMTSIKLRKPISFCFFVFVTEAMFMTLGSLRKKSYCQGNEQIQIDGSQESMPVSNQEF